MLPDQIKKAEIAMVKVGLRALQVGAFVSKPIFEGARYDYIIERDGKLYRAQVKYADGKHKKNCRRCAGKSQKTDQEE
jgi:PD-(D/E)XK endonuclease